MKWTLLPLVLCVGCAAIGDARRERLASRLSSPELCYVAYAGDNSDKTTAYLELGRRNFDCTAQAVEQGHQDFMARQEAAQARRSAAAIELGTRLLTPPPRPAPPTLCQYQANANGTGSMICQ